MDNFPPVEQPKSAFQHFLLNQEGLLSHKTQKCVIEAMTMLASYSAGSKTQQLRINKYLQGRNQSPHELFAYLPLLHLTSCTLSGEYYRSTFTLGMLPRQQTVGNLGDEKASRASWHTWRPQEGIKRFRKDGIVTKFSRVRLTEVHINTRPGWVT